MVRERPEQKQAILGMLHSLAVYHAMRQQSEVGKFQRTAFTNLWNNRDKLNAYTRALLALAADNYGYHDQAKTLVANLENGVKVDSQPDTSIVQRSAQSSDPSVMGTAHWGEDGFYWRWSDGGVEATSFVLRALLAIDPPKVLWPLFVVYGLSGYAVYLYRLAKGKPVSIIQTDEETLDPSERR